MMMNWKGFGRKRSWPNFKALCRHSLDGLMKTTKSSVRIAGHWGQDLNPRPPEYEDGVLTTQARRSVLRKYRNMFQMYHKSCRY
jgi:hypothetical protein